MQVFITIILAISSVSARGSGPYLPSGWRPKGPAFLLPSEVAKSADDPLKESLLQETEGSGSEALREYGPPKFDVVSPSAIQALADVAIEQAFFVEVKEKFDAGQELQNFEVITVKAPANVEEPTTTDSQSATSEQDAQVSEIQPTGPQPIDILVEKVTVQPEQANLKADTLESAVEVIEPTAALEQQTESAQDTLPTKESIVSDAETVISTFEDIVTATVAIEAVTIASQETTTSTNEGKDAVPKVTAEYRSAPAVGDEVIATEIVEEAGTPTVGIEAVTTGVLQETPASPNEGINAVPTVTSEDRAAPIIEAQGLVTASVEEAIAPSPTAEEPVVPLSQQELVHDAVPNFGEIGEVNNVADAVANLEKEVKVVKILSSDNDAVIKSTEETSGSIEQDLVGFLEYGPPDFAEYGPPKQEELAKLSPIDVLDNNEVRRRRFSPKFSSKKIH